MEMPATWEKRTLGLLSGMSGLPRIEASKQAQFPAFLARHGGVVD